VVRTEEDGQMEDGNKKKDKWALSVRGKCFFFRDNPSEENGENRYALLRKTDILASRNCESRSSRSVEPKTFY
jgi:hypothetical protein